MKRRLGTIAAAVCAALTLPISGNTAIRAHDLSLSETLVGVGQATGCCTDAFGSSGTSIVVPGIGRASLDVGISVCGSPCPPAGATLVRVMLSTASGDSLVIDGTSDTGVLGGTISTGGTWSVSSSSTGRYADAAGSGDWSVSVISSGAGGTMPSPAQIVLSLDGAVNKG